MVAPEDRLPRVRRAAVRDELEGGIRRHHPSAQGPSLPDASPSERWNALVEQAARLHLPRVGVTGVEPLTAETGRFVEWLSAGYGGAMDYLAEGSSANSSPRGAPSELLPSARAVIVAAVHYPAPTRVKSKGDAAPAATESLVDAVAGYARGADYHHVVKDRLLLLADALADLVGHPIVARTCVDTAPLLERALAVRAGLGFVGKNTLLITPGLGSYFLLGELLVDVPLTPTTSNEIFDGCGRCRACLDACPTDAFVNPFVLDARRCVSFLTIENMETIPRELRAGIGSRVFGCDECQSVCPFNRTAEKKPSDLEFATRPRLEVFDLEKLLFLGSAQYRSLVRGTALRRANREQLCRNAAIALGNSGRPDAVAPLARALVEHPLALARTHAAWGLGRLAFDFGLTTARDVLEEHRHHAELEVRDEIARWLERDAASVTTPE